VPFDRDALARDAPLRADVLLLAEVLFRADVLLRVVVRLAPVDFFALERLVVLLLDFEPLLLAWGTAASSGYLTRTS
jgi:hypothetical protein